MTLDMRTAASWEGDRRGVDQLAGQITRESTLPPLAVQQLRRRFGLTFAVAALVAELAHLGSEVRR